MKNNTAIVKVENISHCYTTNQWAVNNVSFELSKNGITGLLGSNGAGKSTLMNIMCGVLSQNKGKIFINGIDMGRNQAKAKKQLGFLPQKPPLYNDLTVKEYLQYAASLRLIGSKLINQYVEEAMQKCGISHFKKRLIKNLSGGYQQRVGIAQAIIHNPLLVILDEPTNGLDPNQILEIRNLIKEISKERIVLLSTHILSEVAAMCDHVKMIEHGHMVFEGSIHEFSNCVRLNSATAQMLNPPSLKELQNIEGVNSVEYKENNVFQFNFKDTGRHTEQLIKLSVENGWQLQEIKSEKASLDEIFAFLSKQRSQ